MSDEELKKIIEETVGNNDPYWNEPAFNVVKKIIDLPENAETSIYKLCDNNNKSNSKFMFKIYDTVIKACKKINITLDYSKYSKQFVGLPFNIRFIKKSLSNDIKKATSDSSKMLINIPKDFHKMKSMPKDPANSVVYGMQTQSSRCLLIMYPINSQSAMPYENISVIVDGIHRALADTQGLIEVDAGITKNNKKYVYSIVKSKLEPSGMQYVLTMHIDMNENTINIQAFFDEIGTTGLRDATILNKMVSDGEIVLPNMDGWFKDPYDENYKKGLLMNLSEQSKYDVMFPQHPLSETRSFIKYVVENN